MSSISQQGFERFERGLTGLPELLRTLSPLGALSDQASLAQAVARCICATVAVSCVIHLRDEGALRVVAEVPSEGMPALPPVEAVVATGRGLVSAELGPPCWVVVPLVGPAGVIGTLSLALDVTTEEVTGRVQRALGSAASVLAGALAELAGHQRAAQISQALQTSLLPSALPLADWFDLSARYVPGTTDLRIGGDWYDAQMLPNGTLALSVGDVAGHGIDAAAQMGELRSAMVALRHVRSAPDELISVVHRLATEMGYFATAICARLDVSGRLRWSSAGHLPPLVAHENGAVELLERHQSPPLGIGAVHRVPVNSYRLRAGDAVVLYTDGLVERRDESIDSSLARLAERVARGNRTSPTELIDDLVARYDRARSTGDDIAVLVARWRGEPSRLRRARWQVRRGAWGQTGPRRP